MAATIRAWGALATLEEGLWSSELRSLELYLRQRSDLVGFELANSYHPDLEAAHAAAVVRELGGEVVKTEPIPKAEPGTIE